MTHSLNASADINNKSAESLYDLLGKSNVSKGKVSDMPESNASAATPDLLPDSKKNARNYTDFKSFGQNLNLPRLDLSAQAWVLYDVNAQQILNEFEIKKTIPLGEFNQLMLLYLTFEALHDQRLQLLKKYNISSIAQNIKQLPFDAPKVLLDLNSPIDLQTLIKSMIYTKGFDAAMAISYLVDEDYLKNPQNLIEKMNDKAEQLGLKQTTYQHFAPLLNAQQITEKEHQGSTNVNDLLILTKRLYFDFPKFNYLFEGKGLAYNYNQIINQNELTVLNNANIDNQVIKGFYKQSQNKTGLILNVRKIEKSLTKQERFLIGIIIHAPDATLLEEDSLKMMNYGLAEFDTVKVYSANDVVSQQKLWMGEQNTLKIGVLKDAYIALPKSITARLSTILDKPKFLYAPVEKGQVVAHIRYLHQNKELVSIPIVSLENVKEAFFMKRLWHMILTWFE